MTVDLEPCFRVHQSDIKTKKDRCGTSRHFNEECIFHFSFWISQSPNTAQKMKFFIKDFFSKCDQIRSFLRIWYHLLKKILMENFIFLAVKSLYKSTRKTHQKLKKWFGR